MKVTLNDDIFVIKFRHDTNRTFTTASLHTTFVENPGEETERLVVEENPIWVEVSLCHWRDNYRKATGRKIALARLLEWMTKNRFLLDKEDRERIWKIYFETHKK